MNSIKVCEYSRSRSFYDDLILQDQASGERSQDQWSSGLGKIFKFQGGPDPRAPPSGSAHGMFQAFSRHKGILRKKEW